MKLHKERKIPPFALTRNNLFENSRLAFLNGQADSKYTSHSDFDTNIRISYAEPQFFLKRMNK